MTTSSTAGSCHRASGSASVWSANARRSRTATGAVLWFNPTPRSAIVLGYCPLLAAGTPSRAIFTIGLNLRIAPYQTLELLTLAVWLAPPFDNAQEFGMLRQKQDQIIILATLHCLAVVVQG